jgi:hypothetical protein
LGQALAALLVTEEQKRKCLHGHLVAWLTMKPLILQHVAGHKCLEQRLCNIIKQIYKTEIPSTMHFVFGVDSIKGVSQPRRAGLLPDIKASHAELLTFGMDQGPATQIHQHRSPGTCDPKKKPPNNQPMKCRMGMKVALADKTEAVEIRVRRLLGRNEHDIEDWETMPQALLIVEALKNLAPCPPGVLIQNRPVGSDVGLIDEDGRPIMYVLERRPIILLDTDTPANEENSPDLDTPVNEEKPPNPVHDDNEKWCRIEFNTHLIETDLPEWKRRMLDQLGKTEQRKLNPLEIQAINDLTQEEVVNQISLHFFSVHTDCKPFVAVVVFCFVCFNPLHLKLILLLLLLLLLLMMMMMMMF